jgi:signal transduction histidine kinase
MTEPSSQGDFPVLFRDTDWSYSPLGLPRTWPASLKTAVDLVLRTDAQVVLFWGPEFVALYNQAYAPTIGDKHPRALGRPARENWSELWDDLEPLLRGVRETGKPFSAKDRPFYIERSGFGETVYFDVAYSAVPQEDGSVGGVLCIVSETTERVRAETALRESEARLRELNETLEQRIGERTRALEQAHVALRQAQKMEAVGRLTGGIAHDFNNLLQGITGSFDLIRRKPDDAIKVGRWADAGLNVAERGARLAGQLLAFSRTQKLAIAPIDVTAAVSGFIETVRRAIGPTVRIRTDMRTQGIYAEGDRLQLETAVLNVAMNALDAMPDGGDLLISTRLRRIDDLAGLPAADYVELAVKDSGFGMTAEVAERAFEPFFTTKQTGKGTGLGLSQVYSALHQSGGAAQIDSAPGKGTTVRLLLRVTEPAPAARANGATRSSDGGQATILVVDDDPDVRTFLRDSLESLGYEPVVTEDGPSALRTLERIVPDAVIMDFAMPGMNGAEVARSVRERLPNLPIIFASGYSETSAVSSACGERSCVLHKPFKIQELQTALSELLR